MNLAVFTPLSPVQSGISGYNEHLLPYLAKYGAIDVYVDDYQPTSVLGDRVSIHPHTSFERRFATRPYDMVLYHMGNNPHHAYMYPYLLKYPGIVVLHDYVLHHFISGTTWWIGNLEAYIEEMRYNYGETGDELARLLGRGIWTHIQFFLYPANKRVIDVSLGIVVHSDYIKREIERLHPAANVRKIWMGMPEQPEPTENPDDVKARMGLPRDAFVIGAFGFVTSIKRINTVVEAFRRLLPEVPHARLLIVGEIQDEEARRLIVDLKLEDHVRVTGYVTDDVFHDYILATDMAVNLRYPTAGETSASLLDLMSMKVPVVVFDYRQFSEVPSGCCVKISLGDHEVGELYFAMKTLALNPDARKQIGDSAAEYVRTNCRLEDSAGAYAEFIGQVRKRCLPAIRKRQVTSRVAYELRRDFAEIGIPAGQKAFSGELERALRELGLE
jgi:glycosyltransferase involved in cell wall biosynthesis